MGADVSTVVALDALGLVPVRNGNGNAALLISGSTQGELAVGQIGEGGNGQAVAVHSADGVQDGLDDLDGVGTAFQNGLGLVVLSGSPGSGNIDLVVSGSAHIDGVPVLLDDVAALLQVGVLGSVLHVLDGILSGHDLRQREESGLQDGVGTLAHADLDGQIDSVDGVQLNVVVGDVALGSGIQMMLQLLQIPLAVDQEHAAGLDVLNDLEALGDVGGIVAGNEVGLVDVVGGLDGLVAETQVGNGDAAGLLGVVLEVSLYVLVGVVADDLDGVLVGADGAVAAQTPELALDGAFRGGVGGDLLVQRQVGHIVHDADGELVLGGVLSQLFVDGKDGSGVSILGTQTVTAADDGDVVPAGLGQSHDHVLIQRLALRAGLLGAVQNGNLLGGGGDGLQQLLSAEGTEQADLDNADLLTVGVQVVDDFLGHVVDGAHGDDDAVSIGSAVVVEQLVVGAQLLVDLVHVLLDDCGQCLIVLVAGLTMLEEDIVVLVGAAHCGTLGVQGVLAERLNGIHVAHFLQILVIPDSDLLDLVGGTEAVEEVDEGNAAFDGGQVSDSAQIHDFLHVGLAQHGKTGLTAGVDVGVVTEDVQRLSSDGTGGDVENCGQQLTGDLVHIGDHQQQTLGGGVSGGQSTGSQRAVDSTGGTGLGLHLDDLDGVAEDVLPTGGRPLIHVVSHGAGRGDGVDASDLGKGIADVGGSGIAVHGFEFSSQNEYLLKYF